MVRGIRLRVRIDVYMQVAAGLFLVGGFVGALWAQDVGHLLAPLLQSVHQQALALRQQSAWAVGWELFANNFKVSLYMMVGGVVFGLIPIVGVFANGALVGFVVHSLAQSLHGNPLLVIAAGILPHGVFEIPAYCMASGWGLRLGFQVLRSIAGLSSKAQWHALLAKAPATVVWVAALLLVAAFVESHITPSLIHDLLAR